MAHKIRHPMGVLREREKRAFSGKRSAFKCRSISAPKKLPILREVRVAGCCCGFCPNWVIWDHLGSTGKCWRKREVKGGQLRCPKERPACSM
jgi:hypothetical protein